MQSQDVSPYRLEQAMTLLLQRRAALLEADPDLVADEADLLDLLGTEGAAHDAVEVLKSLVRSAILATSRVQEAARMQSVMGARKARYEARVENLRDIILQVMQALDIQKIHAADFTVSRRPKSPKVVITDDALLPEEYVHTQIVKTPDKVAIKSDLENGVVISGATLSNGGETIAIRTG